MIDQSLQYKIKSKKTNEENCQTGDMLSSEPMVAQFANTCVTWPQWVKLLATACYKGSRSWHQTRNKLCNTTRYCQTYPWQKCGSHWAYQLQVPFHVHSGANKTRNSKTLDEVMKYITAMNKAFTRYSVNLFSIIGQDWYIFGKIKCHQIVYLLRLIQFDWYVSISVCNQVFISSTKYIYTRKGNRTHFVINLGK